jgi:hypothetical protein
MSRRPGRRLDPPAEALGIGVLWCLGVLVLCTCVGVAWWIG